MNTLKIFWKRHKILFTFMSLLSVASIAAVVVVPTLYFTSNDDNDNVVEELSEEDLLGYWSAELPTITDTTGIGKITDAGLVLNSWAENDPGNANSGLTNYVLYNSSYYNAGDLDNINYQDKIQDPNATYYAIDEVGFLYLWDNGPDGTYGTEQPDKPFDLNQDGIYDQYDTVKKAGGAMGTMWAISSSNILYMWGNNQYGQLGNGIDTRYTLVPHPVDLNGDRQINESDFVQDFEIDSYTSMALSSEGYIYTWGSDANGATGHDNYKIDGVVVDNKERMFYLSPQIVDLDGDGVTFSNNSNGDADDKVKSFGQDSAFTPYLSYSKITYRDPHAIDPTKRVNKDIDKFATTMWAISEDGYAYTWGSNEVGQAGVSALYTPVEASGQDRATPESKNISSYYNEPQKLALGVYADEYPAPNSQLKIQDMGISDGVGYALDEEGSVWLWGSSRFDITTLWQAPENWTSSMYDLGDKGTNLMADFRYTNVMPNSQDASYYEYGTALIPYTDPSDQYTIYNDISIRNAYDSPDQIKAYTATPFKLDKELFNEGQFTSGYTDNEFIEVGMGDYSNTAYLINNHGDMYMWGSFHNGEAGRYEFERFTGWDPADYHNPLFDPSTEHHVATNSDEFQFGNLYGLEKVHFRDRGDSTELTKEIASVDTGSTTSVAIDKDGYMYTFGRGHQGGNFTSGEKRDAVNFDAMLGGTPNVDGNGDQVWSNKIFYDDIQLTITKNHELFESSSANMTGLNLTHYDFDSFKNGGWIIG
ncbi:MAG: hypothetical protein HRS57_01875 [Mycoplasmataceae bacterium]|nr:hypothetical protein [Mycoplasmataceae bacterium]